MTTLSQKVRVALMVVTLLISDSLNRLCMMTP